MTRYVARSLTASKPLGAAFQQIAPGTDTYSDDTGIDWIAVERAVNGDYDPQLLTVDERHAAVLALANAGLSELKIAAALRIEQRQVNRWKRAPLKPRTPGKEAEVRQLRPCGTRAAYRRHRARGETPCLACKRANNEHITQWHRTRAAA
ncbi:helix-turn-helix domain-containing protein [Streptomyces sp. NBC_01775]|uniref:helix-turn-helix domain-containing protein n=1 Tax=Streptomyces sp. NBC_01775 TaxID=2975939 RepID=UPI002DDB1E36|nr:helix-turn-helix domain-containing protein [Streptomyces sp. NBC_01775]WSB74782.1 helix-turn-helix domain-containing protein [Streptomyces sp. NBC_01775]